MIARKCARSESTLRPWFRLNPVALDEGGDHGEESRERSVRAEKIGMDYWIDRIWKLPRLWSRVHSSHLGFRSGRHGWSSAGSGCYCQEYRERVHPHGSERRERRIQYAVRSRRPI